MSTNKLCLETKCQTITTGVLVATTLVSGALLMSSKVSADDNQTDEVSISISSSCSIVGTGTSSHTAEIANGQYNSSIGETTATIYCNDTDGFSIYAIGYTDNDEGNNALSNATLGPTHDIATGTGTTGNSQWAMKLSTITSPTPTYPITIQNSFDSFHTVPNDYTLVAKRTSATDVGTSAEGSTFKTTYQAYISQTQPAGTYVGQVKYVLVHPHDATAPEKPFACPANYICYHPNANDAVGTMNAISDYASDTSSNIGYQSTSSNTSVGLYSTNYSRSGYGFAAWNTAIDGTGINYGPNQTITTSDLSRHGLNLYAKWIPAETNVTMQTFDATTSPYSTAPVGTVIALRDTRDNNVYTVAKLVDGVWWMIENLRLDLGSANIAASNTNNPSSTFLQQIQSTSSSDTWCNDPSSASCTDQILYNTSNINRALEPGPNTVWDEHGYEQVNGQWYSYGTYYNLYAATAGHSTLAFVESVSLDTYCSDHGEPCRYSPSSPGDICPQGWRIPFAYTSSVYKSTDIGTTPDVGSVWYLVNQIGWNTFTSTARIYPNNFVLSGMYDRYVQGERGWNPAYGASGRGELWTSTVGDIDEDPNLIYVTPGYPGVAGVNITAASDGLAVRCVATP